MDPDSQSYELTVVSEFFIVSSDSLGLFLRDSAGPLVAVDEYNEVLLEIFQPWLIELQLQHKKRFFFRGE
ncbi:hypothetical protein A0J61_00140 [Choanephora cucurbitarum]|uniref:Uncharacterized protein n=1 Tax=Choanephora cucurbitarum TaxID=101091 RepID=A0A1C7NRN7_9FUNG|nr:hypothetical protein A0J61_00140 [Choanephora cucurbitarum]